MELLHVELTKITYLTILRRPKGQLFLPLAAQGLVDRYHFQGLPENLLSEPPLTFEHGVFDDSAIAELRVYNDGLVVSSACRSETLDAFIQDLLIWTKTTYEMQEIQQLRQGAIYESALVVQLDIDPDRIIPWARPIEKMVSAKWESYGRPKFKFEFDCISVSPDPSERSLVPINFLVERRAGVSFDKNIYFSAAPLKTSDHLEVLAEFEKSLTR